MKSGGLSGGRLRQPELHHHAAERRGVDLETLVAGVRPRLPERRHFQRDEAVVAGAEGLVRDPQTLRLGAGRVVEDHVGARG